MATDTASLIQRSARLETADIDFDTFRTHPLDPVTLRCLRYMHDIEGHTMCYLRDVLVTRAHKDPDLTAFMACWAYEEHWHGEAIARVLDAHGEPSGRTRLEALRRRLPRRDSLRPITFAVGSAFTTHLPAVHMAWGAVNEWCTQTGYARLAAKAKHPVLGELLHRIMKQEGRHIDFYSGEARRRLSAHPRAQRITRFALRHFWSPVGSGVMPPTEVEFLTAHLFGDEAGLEAARRIDRQMDRLPGLAGLGLLERAVNAVPLAA
ncbi:MAG: ferritin-like domain-containing protein [Nitrososphaerales archaeon]